MRNEEIEFTCNQCGYKEVVLFGKGWVFPPYENVIADIESGKYGKRWKKRLQSTPDAVVDDDMELYVCSACGHFQNEINLSIYKRKNPEEIPLEWRQTPFLQLLAQPKFRKKIISFRKPPYFHFDYWKIAYVHRCTECGKRMHLYTINDQLRCPKCKDGQMEETEMWII